MNWDFIRNKGLGGREAEPDAFQLAMTNYKFHRTYV